MIKNIKYFGLVTLLASNFVSQAGNPERAGQAGAGALLIDPYARNSGMWGSNSARVQGLEAQYLNIAGTASTRKTEMMFNRTSWLGGTGIYLNSFGFTQGVGETGTIGLGFVALNSGKIEMTTEDQPDGGLGTYQYTAYNVNLSYAKKFSENIFAGINVKLVSEGINNVTARGVAIDAGIQYHTGKHDQMHLGITLKNWGPKMYYQGDGLSRQMNVAYGSNYQMTVDNKSGAFEMPALVNIGLAYDIFMTKDTAGALSKKHRLSVCGSFVSNSFTYDNILGGLEYSWKEMIMVRGGLYTEKGIFNGADQRRTVFTGPSMGATFQLPVNEKKTTISLDYSYRFTNPFAGVHTFGFRLNL
jgi:hypothetical protein